MMKHINTDVATVAGFTPGPWELSEDGCSITAHNGGTLICETNKAFWENLAAASAQGSTLAQKHLPEVIANARLIASATALFEALQGMMNAYAPHADETVALHGGNASILHSAVLKARAALALVEGGK